MTGTENGWLTHAEQRAWRAYLRASRHLHVRLDSELQSIGLSLAGYELLSMLSEAPDSTLRMGALADMIVQSRSRVSHMVTRLESRSWVTRTTVAGDRRGVLITLTPHGAETVRRACALHVQGVREYFINQIDPGDLTVLGDAMDQVDRHITNTDSDY